MNGMDLVFSVFVFGFYLAIGLLCIGVGSFLVFGFLHYREKYTHRRYTKTNPFAQ